MFRPNRLKERIRRGQPSLATWIQSGAATFAEIASLSGIDALVLDHEHGLGELQSAIDGLRAASAAPATCLVRVPSCDPVYLRRLVDAGVEGVIVPMVESAAEARAIVDACLFPPRGRRGNAAAITRSSSFGHVPDYLARADDNLLISVQIETAKAVENVASIASVEGIDLIFVGPNDLSGSVGVPGQTDHPDVERLIRQIEAAARASGKALATVPRQGRPWQLLVEDGYQLIVQGSDIALYRQAILRLKTEWKEFHAARTTG